MKIYKLSHRIIIYGALANLSLALLKMLSGYIGKSHALFADGVHSLADLFVDFFVYFAARFAHQDADTDHPYGHARIETAATVMLCVFLVLIALGIIYNAALDLAFPSPTAKPANFTLGIILISLGIKEGFYHWTMHYAQQLNSSLLKANAWHHRSDAASSLIVLVGIIAALFGYTSFDALAAIIVGLLIIKMSFSIGWSGLRELVDTGLEKEYLQRLENAILQVNGVQEIHQLRSRSMGGAVYADVHIKVDPFLTVSEGHYISQCVHKVLTENHLVKDVTVHVDPEDDGTFELNTVLPSREILLNELKQAWFSIDPVWPFNNVHFHYLEGKITIEFFLPAGHAAHESSKADTMQRLENFKRLIDTLFFGKNIKDCLFFAEIQLK